MTNDIKNTINNPYSMFKFDSAYLTPAQSKQSVISQKPAAMADKADEFIKESPKSKSNKVIKGALLAFGALGIFTGAIYFLKKGKIPTDNNCKLNFINFEHVKNTVAGQRDKLKNKSLVPKFNPLNLETLSRQSSDSDFEKLHSLFRYEKFGIESDTPIFPDVIFLKGDNTNTQGLGEIIASYFDSKINRVKYPEGKLDEFLQYLSKLADEISQSSEKAPKRNFFLIDNFSKFIEDLQNSGAEDKKGIFLEFLQKSFGKNKTSILVDIADKSKFDDISASAMSVDFKDTINLQKVADDLEKMSDSKKSAFFNALSKIENKPQNMDYPFWCMQYFSAETKKENIVLDGINQKLKQQFLKHLSAYSGERFETFDLSALSLDELISAAQKYKTNFDISGADTILHLQNLEDFTSRYKTDSAEFEKLCDFLNSCYEKYNIRAVYDVTDAKNIPQELLGLGCGSSVLKIPNLSRDSEKLQQEILKNIDELDFSGIAKSYVSELELYAQLFAMERAEGLIQGETFANILLYGKSKQALDNIAGSIKKLFNLNNAQVNFDIKNPDASIDLIVKELKKAKELYEKTGKRTLLTIENLDELLVDTDSLSSRRYISRIKNMTENSVKNNYTTIMIKTTKPLEDFEEASIGEQRFGLKIKLNGEN